MIEVLRVLGIAILVSCLAIGYIGLLNFFFVVPEQITRIANSLEILCKRRDQDGP